MQFWRRLNSLHWFVRLPIKLASFLVVLAVVLYPNPRLFLIWLHRIQNMNSVIDPTHPGLAPFVDDVRARVPAETPPGDVLAVVQEVVLKRVQYAWDWDTWGVMDYLPTVDEVLRKGRDGFDGRADCSGRAVMAASVLRRMGYDAEIVSDVLHVWVRTPYGATMNPTSSEQTLVGGESGTRVTLTAGMIRNLGRGLSYGVGAFPLGREIILLVAIAALALQPFSATWRRVAGCLLLAAALFTIRNAGINAAMQGATANVAQVIAGFGVAIAGWLLLAIRAANRPARSDAARPE